MLSIVVPAFNEEKNIGKVVNVISELMGKEKIDYELVFVDDGSKDATWKEIYDHYVMDSQRIKGVSFSRNFGKEAAIYAGLAEASGDCAVVMDCDLQHPPEKIVEMYQLWEGGYEVVEGVKACRGKEKLTYGIASKIFYSILSKATGVDMINSSDFKLLDRKAINVILNMKERNAFFRALSSWIGFKTVQISYNVQDRIDGNSKWSKVALIQYAITSVTSFTSIPLYFVAILGVAVFVGGCILTIQALCKWFYGMALEGFTTVIILQCFSSSVIMISIGIVGYYVSQIYEEIKGRPKYIISKRI